MIKLAVFDIDGVLTDGTVLIDASGAQQKRMNMKDVDAIFELHRRGFTIAAITGEDAAIVDYFEGRFPWKYFIRGCRDKAGALRRIGEKEGVRREEICYIGDGKYDEEPLRYAGLGVCPADAADRARAAADIILGNKGGSGCLWELAAILEEQNEPDCMRRYFDAHVREHTEVFKRLAADTAAGSRIMELGERIAEAFDQGNSLYLCGNGGSAADAQHIAAEFVSRFYLERPGLNAEALSVNCSTLTAIGNDYSFERIFTRQLEAKGKKGDVVIGISTSGTSGNVLDALSYASGKGMVTAMLTGLAREKERRQEADYWIEVPSPSTPRIQETHIFIGHLLAEYVEARMFGGEKEKTLLTGCVLYNIKM